MRKRIFDVFFAILGILFSSIFVFLLYVLASLDTRQNGIFVQKRIGQYGKSFPIYKLRTFGLSKENPVSKFGTFLRNSKLDELPQFWNVLLGQMSFVGPRPDIAGYYDTLEGENRKILELKPGITSRASIKYANEDVLLAEQKEPLNYNDTVIFPEKVKMNLDYYYTNSLNIDMKIIWDTIFRKE